MDFFVHSFDADFCCFFFLLFNFLVLCMTILFLFGRGIDKYFPIDVIAIYIATNEQKKNIYRTQALLLSQAISLLRFFFSHWHLLLFLAVLQIERLFVILFFFLLLLIVCFRFVSLISI